MTDTATPVLSKFVWHDLMTTDLEASQKFYGELFGWTTETMKMGEKEEHDYRMIKLGDKAFGGFVPLDEGMKMPTHWVAYVTVDDVDAAVARSEKAGGKTLVPGSDIPPVGRFALVADPTGGALSPFKGNEPPAEAAEAPLTGTFCWNELLTTDPEAAKKYYGEVFAWTFSAMGMGERDTYWICRSAGKDVAGMMKMSEEAHGPTHWLSYVAVEDVDATAAQAEKLGAKVFVQPTNIPNVGRFSVLGDPLGATIGLFKSGSKV